MTTKSQKAERHQKIISLSAQGHSDKAIANMLGTSKRTIERDFSELRNNPSLHSEEIYLEYRKAVAMLDLSDPQDRRCYLTNMCRLYAKTLPTDINLKGEVKHEVQIICRVRKPTDPVPL